MKVALIIAVTGVSGADLPKLLAIVVAEMLNAIVHIVRYRRD